MIIVMYFCFFICFIVFEVLLVNVIVSFYSIMSIKVEWKLVLECERNGEIIIYIVEVFNSIGLEVKYVNVSGFFMVIEDLEEYINYIVRVFVWLVVGCESFLSEN